MDICNTFYFRSLIQYHIDDVEHYYERTIAEFADLVSDAVRVDFLKD